MHAGGTSQSPAGCRFDFPSPTMPVSTPTHFFNGIFSHPLPLQQYMRKKVARDSPDSRYATVQRYPVPQSALGGLWATEGGMPAHEPKIELRGFALFTESKLPLSYHTTKCHDASFSCVCTWLLSRPTHRLHRSRPRFLRLLHRRLLHRRRPNQPFRLLRHQLLRQMTTSATPSKSTTPASVGSGSPVAPQVPSRRSAHDPRRDLAPSSTSQCTSLGK